MQVTAIGSLPVSPQHVQWQFKLQTFYSNSLVKVIYAHTQKNNKNKNKV